MFNEHGYPHMKTTGEWCALIPVSGRFHFWLLMGMLGVYSGRAFAGCTFFGRTRVLRTCFFRSSGVPSSVLHGLCFETIENIMKHIDLSLKQRIFKCTVPKVTLNPGNFPLQLLLVGELRSCITFNLHLHWSRRRGKWIPCPWTCSLTRKHSWGIILNNADLRAVVFLFTKKWAVAIMASQWVNLTMEHTSAFG